MTTRVLIVNLGPGDVVVDHVGGLDATRLCKLLPTAYFESYVYDGQDLRVTELRKDNEVANT